MALVRFLLWSAIATAVIVAGVVVGTGVAGAVIGPAVEKQLTAPATATAAEDAEPCPIEAHHEVGYDTGARTYALRAVELSAPTCPPGTRVTVAVDGRAIGEATLDGDGRTRVELGTPLPASDVGRLQVSSVS